MSETTILGSIGAGNMAGAMVEGWLRADPSLGERILVTDRGSGRAARLAERLGVQHVADNAELVRRADVVLIAVKPIDVERVLREASELIDPGTAVVSVAAGVATTTLENVLEQGVPLFRCMPNVGVKVGAGTLCFASGPFTGSRPRPGCSAGWARSAPSSRSRSGCSTPPRPSRAPGRPSSAS